MREFIEKHDEEVKRKSKRRMSQMTEEQRRKQSIAYRRQSMVHHRTNGVITDISYSPEKIQEEPENIENTEKQTQNNAEKGVLPEQNGNTAVSKDLESGNEYEPAEKEKVSGLDNDGYSREIPVYYTVNSN